MMALPQDSEARLTGGFNKAEHTAAVLAKLSTYAVDVLILGEL